MKEGESDLYQFTVVGAGPGGITAIANLLDRGISRIAWVDPHFSGGRLGEKYAEVPSNTKVQLFLDYVQSSSTLSHLVKQASRPNAYSNMEALERDRGNVLRHAADLMTMLTLELIAMHGKKLKKIQAHAKSINLVNEFEWVVGIDNPIGSLKTSKIVLATGSEPFQPVKPALIPHMLTIDLEIALSPFKLRKQFQDFAFENQSVAVVGSSHSAILVLKNLTDLSSKLKIHHLYRSELKFAEYKDGWILYDNTGLKGVAADWAKKEYPQHVKNQTIIRHHINKEESENLDLFLGQDDFPLNNSSRVIFAIGYRASKTLKIMVDGKVKKNLHFDHSTGICDHLPSIFGCGIAYPQRIVDPAGNVEMSVGIFKFMKFLKEVVPLWIQS